MALFRLYTYRDKILLPTVRQAEEGFYMDEAPVTVYGIKDVEQLRSALGERFGRQNEVVPTPTATDEPGSAILDLLGLRKWLKFEADAVMYTVQTFDDRIDYYSTGRALNGAWHPQSMRHSTFDLSAGFEPVINSIINDIERDNAPPKGGGLILRPPEE